MKWDVGTDSPPFMGRGYTVLVDGEEVQHVIALDTDEGWVDAWCLEGHECWKGRDTPVGTWYPIPDPGELHVDPDDTERACQAPRIYGHVEVIAPSGEKVA